MIVVDWSAVAMGGGAGAVMGALFFAGLGLGMRLALRSAAPVRLLAVSAALRIAGLLGVGWVVLGQGGPWAALGYAFGFFIARVVAVVLARSAPPAKAAP